MSARPPGCCGVCPPLARGGYDCTCADNPRCPARIKVVAIRAANGRIQGWAINRGNREITYFGVGTGWDYYGWSAHAQAMIAAQRIARGTR